MNMKTNRRGLLGAMALAPIAVVPAAAAITNLTSTDRAAWDQAMAEYRAAKEASAYHDAHVFKPLSRQVDRVAPRPDLQFSVKATNGQVATYNLWPAKLDEYDDCFPPLRDAAAAERERWLAYKRFAEESGFDAACDRSDVLANEECDARGRLIEMPSPDLAALGWKMEVMFGPEARDDKEGSPCWCADYINAVMADARRLLGREGN